MLGEHQSSRKIIRHTNNLFLKMYKKGIEAALNTFLFAYLMTEISFLINFTLHKFYNITQFVNLKMVYCDFVA